MSAGTPAAKLDGKTERGSGKKEPPHILEEGSAGTIGQETELGMDS